MKRVGLYALVAVVAAVVVFQAAALEIVSDNKLFDLLWVLLGVLGLGVIWKALGPVDRAH